MGTDWKQLTRLPVEAMPTLGELNIKLLLYKRRVLQ